MESTQTNLKEIFMPAVKIPVEKSSHSEILMDAFPALHRAAIHDSTGCNKSTLIELLQYWMTFKEKRKLILSSGPIIVLLAHAKEHAVTHDELRALAVIENDWKNFGPAEYLLGCV